MANVVKPNLQHAGGNVQIKTYGYSEKKPNTFASATVVNDKTPATAAPIKDYSGYEATTVNPELNDILSQQEGKLESSLQQYHIFEEVAEEQAKPEPKPGDPDFVGPMPIDDKEDLKKEEQQKEEPKKEDPKKEEQQKEEPKKEEQKNNNSSKPYGELDMTNYPDGQYDRAAAKERSVLVAKYLVNEGGFTKEQAAAIVGVYWDENGTYPGEVMQAEKRANANSYGAGIGSWTDQAEKNKVLKDAGLPAGTPIESLTLQQQCDMLIASSNGTYKTYYNALRRCDTIEDASATAVCITGGVGFSNNWSTHPTPADAQKCADWYGSRNDRIYGYSDYHHNLDDRRLAYAKEIYAEL